MARIGDEVKAFALRRPLVALFLFALVAWLPGFFTLPPLDRDESRFAQASKQMLETGDIVAIRLGTEARYQKPVGIYWMQAGATKILDAVTGAAPNEIWTYRVPSFFGAYLALVFTFFIGRVIGGIGTGLAASLLLGITVLVMSEAKIAKTDAVLLGCIAVTQAMLFRVYVAARGAPAPSWRLLVLGWAAFGVGVLVKGPVVLFVGLATLVALCVWDRKVRWLSGLKPLWGVGIVALIVLPWVIAIWMESGGAFFEKSLGSDFASKLAGGQESHGAPPGYYLATALLTFWPATFALLPGLVLGWRRRDEPTIRFLLCWAAATWAMFEIAPTKLPHYVMPAFPALAILSAIWLTAKAPDDGGVKTASMISRVVFVLAGAALAGFLIWAPVSYGDGAPVWLVALAGIGGLAAVAAAFLPKDKGAVLGAAAAVFLYGVAGYAVVPRLHQLWLSPRLAESVARERAAGDPPVVVAGYAETSAMFLMGTDTELLTGTEAGAMASKGGLAAVERNEEAAFRAALEKDGASLERRGEVSGLNYSRGRKTTLTLYRVTPRSVAP